MANEEVKVESKKEKDKKAIYFLGTYPEKDWPRMFFAFLIILIAVIFMGTSMYFSYMNTIPTQTTSRTFTGNATTATDVIFEQYKNKTTKYQDGKASAAGDLMVPDPSL